MARNTTPITTAMIYTYLQTHGGCVDVGDPDAIADLVRWINALVTDDVDQLSSDEAVTLLRLRLMPPQ